MNARSFLEENLERLRQEQNPKNEREALPLYIELPPLSVPPPSKEREDSPSEKRGICEVDLYLNFNLDL